MSAGILAELERHGLQVRLAGDKIAVSPKGAITDEVRQIIRTNREEILALLRQAPRPARDLASPWPPAMPGWGDKTLGPLTQCLFCQAATWVRYGCIPLCLACAWKVPPPPDPKTRLSSLLTTWFTINEKGWRQEYIDMIKDMIMDIFRDDPEAGDWFKEWRATHPEAKLV